MLYLGVGVLLRPAVLGRLQVDAWRDAGLLERAAEVADLISFFTAGLKLRLLLATKGNAGIAALWLDFGQLVFGLIRPALMTWLKTRALSGLQSHFQNRVATGNVRRNSPRR